MSKGSRGWCFTLNNYSQEEQEALRNVTCAYMVFGRERGDEGTPHLQGYVHLQHQKTLTAMKKIMPRAHLEVRMGTVDQAVEYCKKEGDYEEFGRSRRVKGKRRRRKEEMAPYLREGLRERMKSGLRKTSPMSRSSTWLPSAVTRRLRKEPLNYVDTPHEWWVGPTGTGKSRRSGKSTQLIMLKRRTSGGVTTRDKTRS